MASSGISLTLTRLRWQRQFARSGWAFQAGAALLVAVLIALGAAQYFRHAASQLDSATEHALSRKSDRLLAANRRSPESALPTIPAYSTHLDDVAALFKLASDQGVELGSIEYRTDGGAGSYVVRSMDLRIDGSYAKLKALVASMLKYLPHLYVREIQVEQAAISGSNVHFVVKLALAYRKPDGAATGDKR